MGNREKLEYTMARDGYRCSVPGCKTPTKFTKDDPPTLDHVIPLSRGGADDSSNWAVAHKSCNGLKGNRLILPDGTLEKLPARKLKIKVPHREPCSECLEGRLLGEDEVCEKCGISAMPQPYPRFAQRLPRECSHTYPEHCWACVIGIYERTPAQTQQDVDVLITEIEDEIEVKC